MGVPEPKRVKNRLHLDLLADGPMEPEVARLIERGARLVEVREDPDSLDNPDRWTVLLDPEGNEVLRHQHHHAHRLELTRQISRRPPAPARRWRREPDAVWTLAGGEGRPQIGDRLRRDRRIGRGEIFFAVSGSANSNATASPASRPTYTGSLTSLISIAFQPARASIVCT